MAVARHPIYGLMTYVGVFYLHPPSRWWGQGVLLDIRWSLVAALVTLIAVVIKDRNVSSRRMPPNLVLGLMLLVSWMTLQLFWVKSVSLQLELIELYAKYALLVWLIFKCVDSEETFRLLLWSHVVGCFYFGWIVYTSYGGGRFEGFGGPGVADANSGAMQIVTGIFAAAVLFLVGPWKPRVALLPIIPFIVNALVASISRSAAVAAAFGGLVFNVLTPRRYRWLVRALSVLAALLFVMLTNEVFWERMETVKYRGQQVEGKDTGAGRLRIIEAQWRMFEGHPLGCGHRCTAILSPSYMPEEMLTGAEGSRGRSSHNSFMTMLVEHGVPGGLFYAAMLWWSAWTVTKLYGRLKDDNGFYAQALPGIAAVLAAIVVGELFVDYVKLEVRFWFMALLLVILTRTENAEPDGTPKLVGQREARDTNRTERHVSPGCQGAREG